MMIGEQYISKRAICMHVCLYGRIEKRRVGYKVGKVSDTITFDFD